MNTAVKNNTPTHSLILDYKKSWANCICSYFQFNIEQITDCQVDDNGDLVINNVLYKFDVSDYTGHSDKYVFFNPTNGRLLMESNGIKKILKFEVDLLDE